MKSYYVEFTNNAQPIDFGGNKVVYIDGKMTILKMEGGKIDPESKRLLASKYKEADFNNDGELSVDEVQRMISMFKQGESPYSQEKIHELIELYPLIEQEGDN